MQESYTKVISGVKKYEVKANIRSSTAYGGKETRENSFMAVLFGRMLENAHF